MNLADWIISYLPIIVLILGVIGYLVSVYMKNGEITIADLYKIVEIAVKSAEIKYINSGGGFDRFNMALGLIASMLGKTKLEGDLLFEIENMIDSVINDLPETTPRIKK